MKRIFAFVLVLCAITSSAYAYTTDQAVKIISDMYIDSGYDAHVSYSEDGGYYGVWITASGDMISAALSAIDSEDVIDEWALLKLRIRFGAFAVMTSIRAFGYDDQHDILVALATPATSDNPIGESFFMVNVAAEDLKVETILDEITNETGYGIK